MGKTWDGWESPAAFQRWCLAWAREVFRVLKPGGHLLAFGGTRTCHRLTAGIEDAGFEIRDGIDWLYASGFPKSLDVSKAIDKKRDDRTEIARVAAWLADQADTAGVTRAQVDAHMGTSDMAGWWLSRLSHRCQVPQWEQWQRLRELIGFGDDMDAEVWRLNGRKGQPGEAWQNAEIVGIAEGAMSGWSMDGGTKFVDREIKAPATDDARQWSGWGTALKPAREPIVMARKPLAGTVAANVLAYGTGALNIDACRVAHGDDLSRYDRSPTSGMGYGGVKEPKLTPASPAGRWPSNVVLSHAPDCAEVCLPGCPVAELDQQSGVLTSQKTRSEPLKGTTATTSHLGTLNGTRSGEYLGESGGASRFFPVFRYQAKAPTSERPRVVAPDAAPNRSAIGMKRCALCGRQAVNVQPSSQCQCPEPQWEAAASSQAVSHPTVKPLDLMRWLVRLVTPTGGVVLEPFAGSGTTAEACVLEGFRCIAIEREAAYLPLITARLAKPLQPALDFGAVA